METTEPELTPLDDCVTCAWFLSGWGGGAGGARTFAPVRPILLFICSPLHEVLERKSDPLID